VLTELHGGQAEAAGLRAWLGRRRVGTGFAVGLAAVGAGLLLAAITRPVLADQAAFLFFVPAAVLAAALGGVWPGAVSGILGLAAALGLAARDGVLTPGDGLQALVFVALSASVTLGGEWYQRARERLEAAHRQLLADLEERRLAEERFQALQSELIHVSRLTALGEMASSLAHELNQPLSAATNFLRGSSRRLAAAPQADPKVVEGVERAGEQTLRAGEIIRRLRDFVARGETERRAESLPNLLDEAASLALLGVRDQGVETRFRYDPAAERVLCDRVQIQQVVLNLIRNAVEAMEGSPVRRLTVSTVVEGDLARVEVADTGSGVNPEIADQLFQPFVTTKRTGMGVGLSISRTIVEAHGGRIWAEPGPDGGTAFRFTLPLAREEETALG
jgi:signal transduction histidine kinase